MSDFVIDHRPDGTPVFVNREEHYLMHHGIPGQKWGHRNGPPYPLDKKDYSREEKRMAKGLKQLYSGKKTDLYGTTSYNTYGHQGDKLNRSITDEVQKYRDGFNIIAEPYYDYVNYFHNLDDADHWTKIIKNEGYDPKEYEKEFINARNKRDEATLKVVEHIVDEVGDLTLKRYKMSGIDKRYLVTGVLRNIGSYPYYDRLPTETSQEIHSDQKRIWDSLTKRYGE